MQVHPKKPFLIALLFAAAITPATHAGLLDWQNQVLNIGSPTTAHYFDTVTGTNPLAFDVGALSGDRTFEFVVNAGLGGDSSALLGGGSSAQALKFEQWPNTTVLGVTAYGIADYNSPVLAPVNTTTVLAFVSSGTSTDLYVGGAYAYTFDGFALGASGVTGLGAAYSLANGSFGDPMDGNILGFASYDTALPAAELAQHAAALAAVPEPSSVALLAFGGVALLRRQRRAGLGLSTAAIR